MNATNTSPATNDTGAVYALIETRLAMAALIGHLCELAERHKVGGRGIGARHHLLRDRRSVARGSDRRARARADARFSGLTWPAGGGCRRAGPS